MENPEPSELSPVQGQMELRNKVAELLASVQSEFTEEFWPSVQPRKVDELRLLVALVSGWRDIRWKDCDCANNADWYGAPPSRPHQSGYRLLDYCNDLNAMHEAEKLMTDTERVRYRICLMFNSDGPRKVFPTIEAALCHATAEQRCRAFVKTMEVPSAEPQLPKSDAGSGVPKDSSPSTPVTGIEEEKWDEERLCQYVGYLAPDDAKAISDAINASLERVKKKAEKELGK